jgi:transposase InsO family protein
MNHKMQIREAQELHKPVTKKFAKRKIVTLGIDDLWAADLVIMNQFSSENDGFKYMINVIDTFSKYAFSEPLKTKSGLEVAKAFATIIKKAKNVNHKPPKLLHVDKGLEFRNKDFKKVLQEHNIGMYHTENEEKSAIVERLNGTLNRRMKIQFELHKSFRWIDILQTLIKSYNNTTHRTIGMKPVDVSAEFEHDLLMRYAKTYPKNTKPKLKVGDKVRITVKKDIFSNKYRRNWTTEIFEIYEVQNTAPVTYKIRDLTGEEIIGSFYELELQKTKAKA